MSIVLRFKTGFAICDISIKGLTKPLILHTRLPYIEQRDEEERTEKSEKKAIQSANCLGSSCHKHWSMKGVTPFHWMFENYKGSFIKSSSRLFHVWIYMHEEERKSMTFQLDCNRKSISQNWLKLRQKCSNISINWSSSVTSTGE